MTFILLFLYQLLIYASFTYIPNPSFFDTMKFGFISLINFNLDLWNGHLTLPADFCSILLTLYSVCHFLSSIAGGGSFVFLFVCFVKSHSKYKSLPLSAVLLSVVLATHGQPLSKSRRFSQQISRKSIEA